MSWVVGKSEDGKRTFSKEGVCVVATQVYDNRFVETWYVEHAHGSFQMFSALDNDLRHYRARRQEVSEVDPILDPDEETAAAAFETSDLQEVLADRLQLAEEAHARKQRQAAAAVTEPRELPMSLVQDETQRLFAEERSDAAWTALNAPELGRCFIKGDVLVFRLLRGSSRWYVQLKTGEADVLETRLPELLVPDLEQAVAVFAEQVAATPEFEDRVERCRQQHATAVAVEEERARIVARTAYLEANHDYRPTAYGAIQARYAELAAVDLSDATPLLAGFTYKAHGVVYAHGVEHATAEDWKDLDVTADITTRPEYAEGLAAAREHFRATFREFLKGLVPEDRVEAVLDERGL